MKEVISKSLKIKPISLRESMVESHFFNSSSYLQNKKIELKGWQLIDEHPIAQVFFHCVNNVAISGYESTFGSFDVVDNVSNDQLFWFLQSLIAELENEGIKKIKIKNFPSYFKQSKLVEDVLNRVGFTNGLTEINQHIDVIKPSFEEVANRSEVIRSNKCHQLGYVFKIGTLEDLPEVYKLISITLERNGNKPSMSFEKLENVINACPQNYILFTLWSDKKLIAAIVSVKLSNSALYNFYHADHFEYRRVSALTYLLQQVYLYCVHNNFKILDLGISSVNGILNNGLFKFKKSRGAVSGEKKYFNMNL